MWTFSNVKFMLKCREFNYFVTLKNKPLCRKINVHPLQKVWTFLEIRAWTFSFPKFSDFFRVCLFVDAKRQWIYLAATVLSYTMEVTSQCMGQSPFTLFLAVRSIGRANDWQWLFALYTLAKHRFCQPELLQPSFSFSFYMHTIFHMK